MHLLSLYPSHIQTTDGLESSCLFLETVLFHDFPPELFLQRPALLKVCHSNVSQRHTNLFLLSLIFSTWHVNKPFVYCYCLLLFYQVLFSLLERHVECLPSLCPCLSQLSSQLARRIASLEASAHDRHTFNGIQYVYTSVYSFSCSVLRMCICISTVMHTQIEQLMPWKICN